MNEIIAPIVRPEVGAISDFILMDDNARPHRITVVNQYLEKETNKKMDWPAKASDLNPKSMYGTSSRDKYQLEANPI